MESVSTLVRCLAIAALCRGCFASGVWRRSLAQSSDSGRTTAVYSPTSDGGITLVSGFTLFDSSGGNSSLARSLENGTSRTGFTLSFPSADIVRSGVFQNAACVEIQLQNASSGIKAFLSSYADYLSLFSNDKISLAAAVVVGSANLSSENPGPVIVPAAPADKYVLVIYTLDTSPQTVTYFLTAHPKGSPACAAASPATAPVPAGSVPSSEGLGAASAPGLFSTNRGRRKLQQTAARTGPAAAPAAALVQTVQATNKFELRNTSSPLVWSGGFTNASCLAYRILGQSSETAKQTNVDLSVFILDAAATVSWAQDQFSLTSLKALNALAPCYQNNTGYSACSGIADGLNASKIYFVWGATGLQQPSLQRNGSILFDLAYTAQSSGSCADNAVSAYSDSETTSLSFASSANFDYDYDYNYFYNYEYNYFYNYEYNYFYDYEYNYAYNYEYNYDYDYDYDYEYDYNGRGGGGSSGGGGGGSSPSGRKQPPPPPTRGRQPPPPPTRGRQPPPPAARGRASQAPPPPSSRSGAGAPPPRMSIAPGLFPLPGR